MANKKRRKKRTMSSHTPALSAPKKRRKKRRRRRGLSEGRAFGLTNVRKSATATFSGMTGGVIAALLNRFEMPGLARLTTNLAASFAISHFMDAPETGAGVAGAYGMILTQQLTGGEPLGEDADYAEEDVLEKYPMFLDENGQEMYLAQNNELYYLEQGREDLVDPRDELMSQEMYLAENIYPAYVNPAEY